MGKENPRLAALRRRHKRVRKKIHGTAERPRLCVYLSLRHIHAQLIDDDRGHTLVSASTCEKSVGDGLASKSNIEAAKVVGRVIAERAVRKGITRAVFDRSGHIFHGRVKALAEAAIEAGLKFTRD